MPLLNAVLVAFVFAATDIAASNTTDLVARVGQNALIYLNVYPKEDPVAEPTAVVLNGKVIFEVDLITNEHYYFHNNYADKITNISGNMDTISFSMMHVTPEDSGTIKCFQKLSCSQLVLEVTYPPSLKIIEGFQQRFDVGVGDTITFTCSVNANPIPSVRLSGGNDREVNGDIIHDNKYLHNFSVSLTNLTHLDQGNFSIIAENDLGSSSWMFDVKIRMLPALFPGNKKSVQLKETDESWHFDLWAYPKPKLRKTFLIRPGKPIKELFLQTENMTLKENLYQYTVKFKGPDYVGTYIFQFSNDVGVMNATINLERTLKDKETFNHWLATHVLLPVVSAVVISVCLLIIMLYCVQKRLRKTDTDRMSAGNQLKTRAEARSLITRNQGRLSDPMCFNRGERNSQGVLYADLFFPPVRTSAAEQPVIIRQEPPTQFAQIGFTLMPSSRRTPRIREIKDDDS